MELPRLSVIVPNYNHAAYLPRALDAIFNQSAPPFEVIVIDDASTDNSLEVLERYAHGHPNLRVYRNNENRGVVYGLNRGLHLAKGDYVTFPAADDEIIPGLFEKSLRLLAQYPHAALSCAVCEWSYVDSGLTWRMGTGMAEKPCYLSPDNLVQIGRRGKLFIGTSSVISRREALIEAGGFLSELRWHCDWFAVFIPAFRHGICYVPEALSKFNIYTKSFYSSGSKGEQHLQVLTKLAELLTSPAFADVHPRVRNSGALSLFAIPMLKVLCGRKEFRSLITWTFLRRMFRRNAELVGKRILPRPLQRWVLNRLYKK